MRHRHRCAGIVDADGGSASSSGGDGNLAGVSLATDMVFADGATLETPSVSGSVSAGYAAALTVGVVF